MGRDRALEIAAAACFEACAGAPEAPTRAFESEVLSALAEAFSNVAVHAYRSREGDLELEVIAAPGTITVRVKDWGVAFDLRKITQPDLRALPESGMGMFIIRKCMDDVGYEPGRPNILTMTKRLKKKR